MKKISKKFLKDSHFIVDLKLSTVRLVDNNKFPWIILIPNRKKITDITELKSKDQLLLMKEIVFCSEIMKKIFKTSKLNVEKIGNIVPQLHIHIIARFKKDTSWPLSVWVVKGKPYSNKTLEKTADKLVNAFIKNKIIAPIPLIYTKKISNAQKLRKLCESKIKDPIIGFKAAGTGIPVIKKLKEKEPFYASVYKRNFLKSGKKVKINKSTLGIELEVCYLIKKNFFISKRLITMKNISKFISHMAPCIEVVGYRQKKKGITSFGDLCSDFGANVKFLIGQKKKYKKINIGNLKTVISNKKTNQSVSGNTNTVYINPLNSLRFVLNKLKKDKINLNKDFYVFTGSTVGVVPILGKGLYTGKVEKLGSTKAIIF